MHDGQGSSADARYNHFSCQRRFSGPRSACDLQLQALMEIWLYLHVPLSFALLGALTAHIVSVFFYW